MVALQGEIFTHTHARTHARTHALTHDMHCRQALQSGSRPSQRQRLQMVRMLRGAGHPHSAALASQMEPDGEVVLASFAKGRRGR